MSKEEVGRKIEAHLMLLVDYDVLDARTADTMMQYIWEIINDVDTPDSIEDLKEIWKRNEDESN